MGYISFISDYDESSKVDAYWTSGTDRATEGTFIWESTGGFESETAEIRWKNGEPNVEHPQTVSLSM
jgi:hypothetical protein